MKGILRVAIYTRVSTQDQSCVLQLAELRKYAADRGWQVVGEYIDTVTGDVNKRIKRGRYTRYDDLMKDAQNGIFQAVIVWKFDRFARSTVHLVSSLEKFQELGIDFISTTQNIDTTTPMGKLFFTMLGAFAEFERNMIRERCMAGIRLVQETGINSKGEKVTLGKPEQVSYDQKESILHRYHLWEPLSSIAEEEKMPLSTVYSIIKRSLVQCSHGKYRCKSCRISRRISPGTGAGSPSEGMESRRSPLL